MASGSDGSADFRVQRLNGVRGVDQPADLRRVVEKRNDLVPGSAPAGRDRRIPPGQVVILELCQGQFCRLGINGRVDSLEGGRDSFAVFVAGEVHGMAQQVDDAGLDPGLRKGGLDGLRKAFQPVHDGDEDVLDAPIAQVAENLGPELRALIGLEPQAQNVPRAIRQNREGHEDRLVRDRPIAADIDPDRVHEDDRIAGFQRAVLPGGDLLHDRVADCRNQAGRGFNPIDFLEMTLDLAGRHAPGIHADDLAIELRKAPLILGDQHRIERAVPVTGDVQNHLAAVGGHRLLAAAIAPIEGLVVALRRLLGALFIEMDVHFSAQRTFRKCLGQFCQDAGLAK